MEEGGEPRRVKGNRALSCDLFHAVCLVSRELEWVRSLVCARY